MKSLVMEGDVWLETQEGGNAYPTIGVGGEMCDLGKRYLVIEELEYLSEHLGDAFDVKKSDSSGNRCLGRLRITVEAIDGEDST